MRLLVLFFLALTPILSAAENLAVVRVNVTSQGWDFQRPWGKRNPTTKRAIGAVIEHNKEARVLVTGDLVQNSTYLEFEVPEGGRKAAARVDVVDYEANLALLATDDAEFLKGLPRLAVAESSIGDAVSVWQLEGNGRLLITPGIVTTAETAPYPLDGVFLVYRVTAQMQSRDSSFTLPVVNNGKLTGVLMSYDAQSKNANLIPAPVIQHFVTDAADGKYDGFPRAGYGYSPMRDPALRRFAKVPEGVNGGIYITETLKDGAAEKAGLRKGDVIVAVGEHAVDQDGHYNEPKYGEIALGHLLSTRHYVGEKLTFHLLREGEKTSVEVTLSRKPPQEYVSDPYIIDTPPRFHVVGGLILQELSRQYLREFATPGERGRRPPDRLAYYDRYQNELFRDGPKKIVFMSRILPTSATVGYEDLSALVVTKINGTTLQSLEDVAKAIEKPINGFHEIEFNEDPKKIYLDAAQVADIDRTVQTQYRLPALKNLN